jgi:hypothetical protein
MNEAAIPTATRVSIPPPRLHWGWLLALSFVTGFLFYGVWLIVQSNWARRTRGRSVAFPMAVALCAAQLAFMFVGDPSHGFVVLYGFVLSGNGGDLAFVLWLIAILLRIVNFFVLRRELMNSPIFISLSSPMTFFFGPIYFQYHLRNYRGIPLDGVQGLGLSQQSGNTPGG